MATFEVKVYRLKIETHPNADTLELARVGDYRSCVRKGDFKTGDYGVYIPEASIVPDWLITKLGLTGRLAGPQKNRVKAMKLRGSLSQGLIYPVEKMHIILEDGVNLPPNKAYDNGLEVVEGQDVQHELGITKYDPPIPAHMAGEVFNAHGYTLNYDIENIKKFPDIFSNPHETVLITEKLHGTWTCFGFHPDIDHPIVTSKGFSGKGLAFKFNEVNGNNLYIRSLAGTTDVDGNTVIDRLKKTLVQGLPFYILGETYGKGVQDLTYGLEKPHFRAFDIYVGKPGVGRYLAGHEFLTICNKAKIETVPVLWHGTLEVNTIATLTTGNDNITGSHIREGIVIRPFLNERYNFEVELGRVILKSVSEAYLLRKGNATEFN